MQRHDGRNNGFTLMEMLVVVAIIAVLTAIAIPVFNSSMEKAKEATCAANCRALKGVLSSRYLLGELPADSISQISLTADNDYSYEGQTYSCPCGGKIYAVFENGSIDVRCEYHTDKKGGDSASPVWTAESATKIWDIVGKYSTGISSQAVNDKNRKELLADLEKEGIDLNEMGAADWYYTNDSFGKFFQWTTADLSQLKTGDSFTVIRYRLDGKYQGLYTVWKGKIGSKNGVKTVETYSSNGDEYTSALTAEEKKDIQNAIQIYNDRSEGFSPLS